MFGKLKDKLKKTLSIFSKKTEEEAEEVKEVPIIKEVIEEPIEPVKEEVQEEIKEVKEKEEISTEETKELVEEEPVAQKEEEKEEEKVELQVEKDVKEQEASAEEVKEEVTVIEEPVVEEKKKEVVEEIPVPEKYDAAQHKYVPDQEKIKETKEKLEEEIKTKAVIEKKETEKVKEVKQEVKEEPKEEKKSFFGKIKQSLTTKTISINKFDDLFWDLELVLLENNVSVEVIEKIKEDLKKELVDKPLPRDVFGKISETLKNTLTEILSFDKVDIDAAIKNKKPYIISVFGINGAGKTTSIAKLAYHLQQKGYSIVLAACDTFRAAAIDQLEEHANNLNIKMIKHDYGSDAAAVAYDAVKYAEKNKIDVVMIDTAGRLHSNVNLMAELEKIIRIAKPDLKLFVGESITGNDCIEQARKFDDMVGMDGAILTKADVDEKGGAPISITYTIKKPILFLGVGQEYKDLIDFDKDVVLERLGFD